MSVEAVKNPKVQRREDARFLRDAMSKEMREAASKKICNTVTSMASFGLCDTILCYSPIGSEVDVLPIAAEALKRGKKVGFPVCFPDGEMEFYAVESLSDLVNIGKYDVKEPMASEERRIVPTVGTMVLMPGLLFDYSGHRIGYGGGYYDKYIRRNTALFHSSMTIGITYAAFLSDTPIPYTDLDISAALVVTEKKINFVRKIEKAPKHEVRKRRYVPLLDSEGNEAAPAKRDFYNANYVSPDEGKYKKPKAKDIEK